MTSLKRFTAVLMSVLMLMTSMPTGALAGDTIVSLKGFAPTGTINPNYSYRKADNMNEGYNGALNNNHTAISYGQNTDGTNTYLVRLPALPAGAQYTQIGGVAATKVSTDGTYDMYSVPVLGFNSNNQNVTIVGKKTSFSVIFNVQGVGLQYYDVSELANQDVKYDADENVRQYIERVEYSAYAGQIVTQDILGDINQGANSCLSRAKEHIAAGEKYKDAYNTTQGNKGFAGCIAPTFDQNNPIIVSTGKEDYVEVKITRKTGVTLERSFSYSSSPPDKEYVYEFVQNMTLPNKYLILSQMYKAVPTINEQDKVFEQPIDLYITPLYGHYENYGKEDLNYTCDPLRSLSFSTIAGKEYTGEYLSNASNVEQVLSELNITMTSFGTVNMGDVSAHQYHFHFAMPDSTAKFEFRNYIAGSEPVGFVVTSPSLTGAKWIKTGTNAAVKAGTVENAHYRFGLYCADGTLMNDNIINNSNGDIIFSIPITAADVSAEFMKAQVLEQTLDYYLQEIPGTDPTVTYDPARHPIKVTLSLNESSKAFSATAEWVGTTDDTKGTFTNKVSNDRVISVEKKWVNDPANTTHDTITLYLDQYLNGAISQAGIRSITLGNGTTQASFASVPIKSESGIEYTYQVREEVASGSFYQVSYAQPTAANNYKATVTNTYSSTTLTLVKKWKNDRWWGFAWYRPAQVKFVLSDNSVHTLSGNKSDETWSSVITVPTYDANGDKIIYSAYEQQANDLAYYTTATTQAFPAIATGGTITITNEIVDDTKTSISVRKDWQDGTFGNSNNADVEITLTLSADSKVIIKDPVQKLTDGNWQYTWSDLPKYRNTGRYSRELIEYTVTETSSHPEYDTEITGQGTGTVLITNKLKTQTLSLEKAWNDNGREKTINAIVFTVEGKDANSVTRFTKDVTLYKEDDWRASVEVPSYIDHQLLTYTVTEKTAIAGYTPENHGVAVKNAAGVYVVTNSLQQVKREITVTKKWVGDNNDTDGKRKTVHLILWADGVPTDKERSITCTNGTWSIAKFENLDVYHIDSNGVVGSEIEYSVVETPVDGYTATYSAEKVSGTVMSWAIEVTNTYGDFDTTSVTVTKDWQNDGSENRPAYIQVQLQKNGVDEGDAVTLNASNSWTTTWDNLPLNQPKADALDATTRNVYTVVEVGDITDYDQGTWVVTSGDKLPIEGTITNRYNPHFNLIVNKSWDDEKNADGIRPSTVKVQLYRYGASFEERTTVGEPVELVNDQYKFTDLPSFDTDGSYFTYYVEELELATGYERTEVATQSKATIYDANMVRNASITVTNKHQPMTASLVVVKAWEDGDNADGLRVPVTVRLYQDGDATDRTAMIELNAESKCTFEGLQVYKTSEQGVTQTPIVYTVREETVPTGYTVDNGGSVTLDVAADPIVVTNTHTPDVTTFTVTKKWEGDNDNADGNRPQSVSVRLYQGSMPYESTAVDLMAEDWTHTWTGLPKNYWDGTASVPYRYSVREVSDSLNYDEGTPVPTAGGAEITNTYNPEKVSIDVSKSWPNDVDSNTTSISFNLYYVDNNGDDQLEKANCELTQVNGWQTTINDLLKYRDGQEVVYAVEEADVTGYTPAVPGKIKATKVSGQASQFEVSFTNNRNDYTYTVRYWKDMNTGDVNDAAHFLAAETVSAKYGETAGVGDGIDHLVKLNKHKPTEPGYVTDGVINPTSITVTDNDGILDVVYTTTGATYTVKYWLDAKETGTLLSSEDHTGVVNQTVGDANADISIGEYAAINTHDGYEVIGERDANITLTADGPNEYNVVYKKKALNFDVEYVYDVSANGMTQPAYGPWHQDVVVGDTISYTLETIDPAFYIDSVVCIDPGTSETAVTYDSSSIISGTMPGHDVKYLVTLQPYLYDFNVVYTGEVPTGLQNETQEDWRAGDPITPYSLVDLAIEYPGYEYDYTGISMTEGPAGTDLRNGDDFSGNMPNGSVTYEVPIRKIDYTLDVTYQYSTALTASGLTLPTLPNVAQRTGLNVGDPVSYTDIPADMATLNDSRFTVSDIATGCNSISGNNAKTEFSGTMPADNVSVVITIDAPVTTYEVRYYKDQVDFTTDSTLGYFIDRIGPSSALVGDLLGVDGTVNAAYTYGLDQFKPASGYQSGAVASGDMAIMLKQDGTKNIINVLYKPLRKLVVEYVTSDGKPVPQGAGMLPAGYTTDGLTPDTEKAVAVPTLVGYTSGWVSDPGAATTANTDGSLKVTMPDQDVKVIVTYTPVNYSFEVHYSGEGAPTNEVQTELNIGNSIAEYTMPQLSEGYEYDFDTITRDADSIDDGTEFRSSSFITNKTFSGTMPAHDVVYEVKVIRSHSVTVEKIWNDGLNRDNVRPAEVTIRIFGDGTEVAHATLTAADGYSQDGSVWRKNGILVPVYYNGVKITSYTVTEDALSVDGYTMSLNSYDTAAELATVTNTREPETVKLSLTKNWTADDAKPSDRQDVTVVILAGTTEINRVTITGDQANAAWSKDVTTARDGVTPLYKYENGTEIVYTAYELPVAGYDGDVLQGNPVALTIDGNNNGAATFTNTHQNPSIDVTKTVTNLPGSGFFGLNDVVEFKVVVTNNGNEPLTSVQLTDTMEAYANGDARTAVLKPSTQTVPTALAVGDSFTLIYTYTVVEADLGSENQTDKTIANTADVSAQFGDTTVTDTDTVTFPVAAKTYGIDVTKDVDDAILDVGQEATFTITVKNIGTATLSGIKLVDELIRNKDAADAADVAKNVKVYPTLTDTASTSAIDLSTFSFDLAPGAERTFTCTYTAQASDITLVNTATATAQVPGRDDVTDSDDAAATVAETSDFAVLKTIANVDKNFSTKVAKGATAANDTINYQIVVSNEGNTKRDHVSLADVLHREGLTDKTLTQEITPTDYSDFTLLVGESKTFTVSYKLTESDYKLDNVATATWNGIDKTSHVETEVGINRELTILKEATNEPADGVAYKRDEAISYKVTITNVGNQKLTEVALSDTLVAFADMRLDPASTGDGTAMELDVGETFVYTYTYTVLESDLGKTNVTNTATASAKDTPEVDSTVDVPVDGQHPSFEIKKEVVYSDYAAVNAEGMNAKDVQYAAGNTVYFKVTLHNTGNCALTNVTITDAIAGMQLIVADSEITKSSLAYDGTMVAYYSYDVTQADLGKDIVNTSTGDADVVDPLDASATAKTANVDSRLAVSKTTIESDTNAVAIDKSTKRYDRNDYVYFQVTVTNPGNLDVKDIVLDDAIADVHGAAVELVSGNATKTPDGKYSLGTLTAGDTTGITLSFRYQVVEADLMQAEKTYVNTATVTGTDSQNNPVTPASDEDDFTTVARRPSLNVTKQVVENQTATAAVWTTNNHTFQLDDTVLFRIVVENDGNVKLAGVDVTDALANYASGDARVAPTLVSGNAAIGDMEVGDKATLYYTYKVVENDLAQNSILNTATATADDGTSKQGTADFKTEDKAPALSCLKTVTGGATLVSEGKYSAVAGATVTFTITVKNEGNVTLNNVKLSDVFTVDGLADLTKLKNFTYSDTETYTLAPKGHSGDARSFTASYMIGETDAVIINAVTATSTETPTPTPESKVEVDVELVQKLDVEKTASLYTDVNGNGKYDAGDTVRFTITVKNLGNRALTGLTLEDVFTVDAAHPAIEVLDASQAKANVSGYTFPLGKGGTDAATATFTADYTIGAHDKAIANVVTAGVGTKTDWKPDKKGETWDDDDAAVTVEDAPALSVVKTVVDDQNAEMAANHPYKLGDTVRFQIVVKNEGNTTLENITITDTMPEIAQGVPRNATAVSGSNNIGTLAPGKSATVYYTYTVVEGDLGGQTIRNTAKAASGATESNESSDDFVTDALAPDYDVLKKIVNAGTGESGAFQVGDTIQYEIYVVNIGNQTLPRLRLTDALKADDHAETLLTPSFAPAGEEINDLPPVPAASLKDQNGQYILTGANVKSFTASYKIKSTDAQVDNTATVKVPGSNTEKKSTVSTPVVPAYAVAITKVPTGGTGDAGAFKTGDTVKYTITVTNMGNYPLSDLKLGDKFYLNGSTTQTTLDVLANGNGFALDSEPFALKKGKAGETGESKTFTATYKVLSTDTKLDNTARVYNDKVDERAPSVIDVGIAPVLTIQKTVVDADGNALDKTYALGETVRFRIDVKNDGNVALTEVTVSDLLPAISSTLGRTVTLEAGSVAAIGTLGIGETAAPVYYTYVITEADLASTAGNPTGTLTNTGKVSGKYNGNTIEKADDADFTVAEYNPALSYVKTAANADATKTTYEVGDTVNFTITLTNTGNVTLTNVTLLDLLTINGVEQSDLSKLTFTGNAPAAKYTLYPQGHGTNSMDFTASYVIQPSDCRIINAAKGDSDQTDPGDPSVVTVDVVPAPAIEVTKTAANADTGKTKYEVADTVNFTITATNKGNTEQKNLKLVDLFTVDGVNTALTVNDINNKAVTDRTTFSLAIGETATFTASYTVDATAGKATKSLNNHVYIGSDTTWPPADQGKTWDDGEVPVTIEDKPEIEVVKTVTNAPANGTAFVLGETVAFDITVYNRGNVALTGIDIEDALLGYTGAGLRVDEIATLAVGGSETLHYSYTIQEKDLITAAEAAAGIATRENVAVATADDGTTDDGKVDFPVAQQNPSLQVDKAVQGTKKAAYALDETVTFDVTVTNNGNMTLYDVKVADPLCGSAVQTIGTMVPGDTTTLTFSLTVTQAMLGQTNTNIATGTGHTTPNIGTPDSPAYGPTDETVTDPGEDTFDGEARRPELTVEKTIRGTAKTEYALGDTITFDVTVENTGNVTVYDIELTDPMCFTQNATANAAKAIGTLVPGQKKTGYTFTYTVTEGDLQKTLTNVAYAKGKTDRDEPVDDDDDESFATEDKLANMAVLKEITNEGTGVDPTDPTKTAFKVGDTVQYKITVTNTGNTTLQTVTMSDVLNIDNGESTPELTLNGYTVPFELPAVPAGDTSGANVVTFTASYTIEAGDKQLHNVATAVSGNLTREGTADTTVLDNPALDVDKSIANLGQGSGVSGSFTTGDVVRYEIVVKNTGNVPLTTLNLTDTFQINNTTVADRLTFTETEAARTNFTLQPGESVTFHANCTVKATDVKLYNYALVKDTDTGAEDDDDDTNEPGKNPILDVTKIVVDDAGKPVKANKTFALGETVHFLITVSNLGNVDFINVVVNDPLTGDTETIASLPVGGVETFTFDYVILESDIRAGKAHNVVTATASDGTTDEDDEDANTDPVNPSLIVDKTESSTPQDGAAYKKGETVTFNVNVKNNGNVTLNNIAVADAIVGNGHADVTLTGGTLPIAALAPAAEVNLTYAYVVQEADLGTLTANGKQTNRATASTTYYNDPTDPTDPGTPVTSTDDEDFDTEKKAPALEVTKTVKNAQAEYKLGETITFEVVVKNVGNVTLTNITLTDPICLAQNLIGNADKTIASLAPGASTAAFTYTYVVQESDLGTTTAQGSVHNIATATTTYDGETVTDDGDADATTETSKPGLTAEKTVIATANGPTGTDANGKKIYVAGDTITYQIIIANTGNTTLTDVNLTDTLTVDALPANLATSNIPAKVTLAPKGHATQAVSDTVTYTATYVIGQYDSGIVKNVILATHDDIPDAEDEVETPIAEQPAIQVDKNVTNMPQDGFKVGDTVKFEVKVSNIGNTTLTGIHLQDEFTVDGVATALTLYDGANPIDLTTYTFDLTKNTSKTFTAEYTIANTDAAMKNVAKAGTGDPSDWDDGNKGETWDDGDEDVTVGENPALNVVKTVTSTPANRKSYALGETVTFNVEVENIGNTTLKNIVVEDPMCRAQNATIGANQTILTLAPKAKQSVTFTYVVQESDLGKNSIVNVVTATADDGTKDDDDEPFTPDPRDPSLDVIKTVVTTPANADGTYAIGQAVSYSVKVTNDGNVTLNGINVYDDLCGETRIVGTLVPGQAKTVTFIYTVKEADLQKKLTNIATATADDGTTDDDDETVTTEDKKPAFTIVKSLENSGTGENGAFKVGETARFLITVTNTGNVTLNNLVVSDPLAKNRNGVTNADQTLASLARGTAATFAFTYTITEDDLGKTILNIATCDTDETPSVPSNEVPVPVEPRDPKVQVEKTVVSTDANRDGKYASGETVRFAVKVSNLGNVELKRIVVDDQLPGTTLVSGVSPIASLPVGQSTTLYYEYVVKEADLGDKPILNIVTATPSEGAPDDDDEPFTPDPRQPAMEVTKTLTNLGTGVNGAFKLGETAIFTVTVANTGNVTLKNVRVVDQMAGARLTSGNATITTLAVGQTVTLTYAYTIQAADLAKTLTNIVTATADDDTTDDDDEDFVTAPKPDIIVIVQTTDGSPAPFIPGQQDVTPGTDFVVDVPNIPGYTRNITVTSTDTKFTRQSYTIGNTDVTGIMASEDVIITIIYSPRVDCRYRVEYYYDGVLDDTKTEQTAGVTFGTVVSVYPPKNMAGYRFARQENLPLQVGMVADSNVIRIYYVSEQPIEIIVPADIPLGAGNAGLNVGVCAE